MTQIQGGPAIPVSVVTGGKIKGGKAIPVYGYTSITSGQTVTITAFSFSV